MRRLDVGLDHPLGGALIVVPALELAATIPLTPGNLGLATASAALALQANGAAPAGAFAGALVLGLAETTASIALGAPSACRLFSVRLPGRAVLSACVPIIAVPAALGDV